MWVLSVDAGTLLSVVQFDQKKAPAMAKAHGVWNVDGDFLLIRARHKPSLEYVCDVLDALSKDEIEGYVRPKIDTDTAADYHYRTIVSRDEWKRYLMFEVDGIDYDSHVKEETCRRQPEPKIKREELYKALSATWRAWELLQPLPAYHGSKWSTTGSYSWAGKPDCVCGHTELRHAYKGDSCNGPWNTTLKKNEGCSCNEYRPLLVINSAKASAEVFKQLWKDEPKALPAGTMSDDTAPLKIDYSLDDGIEYPNSAYLDGDPDRFVTEPEVWDKEMSDEFKVLMEKHEPMCPALWYDPCECGADEEEALEHAAIMDGEARRVIWSEVQEDLIEGTAYTSVNGVLQEEPVAGETRAEKKARNARNRRARRRATRGEIKADAN